MAKGESGEHMILRRFLLGQLGDDERAAIERRFFEDAQLFDLLLAVEDELIDEYARGVLKGNERARWEQVLAADPAGGKRVKFASALSRKVAQREGWVSKLFRRRGGFPVWAPVAIAIVLIVGMFSLRRDTTGPGDDGGQKATVPVFAFSLIPGTVRGTERQQTVVVPRTATRLRLNLEGVEAGRRVEVRNVDTAAIITVEVRAGKAELDANQLGNGDYIATVSDGAGQELADYSFRITRDER